MTSEQAASRDVAEAMADETGNLPPLSGIFPDMSAPLVRDGDDRCVLAGGARRLDASSDGGLGLHWPLDDEALRIVARGRRSDGGPPSDEEAGAAERTALTDEPDPVDVHVMRTGGGGVCPWNRLVRR